MSGLGPTLFLLSFSYLLKKIYICINDNEIYPGHEALDAQFLSTLGD